MRHSVYICKRHGEKDGAYQNKKEEAEDDYQKRRQNGRFTWYAGEFNLNGPGVTRSVDSGVTTICII